MTKALRYPVIVFSSFLFLSSCAVVQHLDEAATLQEYSRERDALAEAVEDMDRKFDRLLARIASGDKLADLDRREALLARLGDPILAVPGTIDGFRVERWLYRYQTRGLSSPKVYFILNGNGDVLSWIKEDPPHPVTQNAKEEH